MIALGAAAMAYFIIAAQILMLFGIAPASILAVAGIGSIAIGFGAQKMVADFITGATILFENQFRVGDWVEINGQSGEVESISLRTTRLRALNGNIHTVPNSAVVAVINSSQGPGCAVVDIPAAYRENIDRVCAAVNVALQDTEDIDGILDRPNLQGIVQLGERCLTLRVLARTRPGVQAAVERQLRYRIKRQFEREGIQPPYPSSSADS
jgi:small conductance mechanosensitive channel